MCDPARVVLHHFRIVEVGAAVRLGVIDEGDGAQGSRPVRPGPSPVCAGLCVLNTPNNAEMNIFITNAYLQVGLNKKIFVAADF